MLATRAIVKAQSVPKRGRHHEGHIVEFIERGFRQDPVEQARQRHVDQEEIEPGEARIRDALELSAQKPEKNQPEIGKRKIEDVDHRACLAAPAAWVNVELDI